MALAGKVNYEITAPVKILAEGEDTGVVFNVKSIKCKAARELLQRMQRDKMQAAIAEEEAEDAVANIDIDDMPSLYAACVDSWEWNGENFKEGDPVDPDFSKEYCEQIFRDDEGYFIYEQVIEKVTKLGKPKPAPKKKR